MTRMAMWAALFLSTLACASSLYAKPILNGDFESEDAGYLAWWQPTCVAPVRIPNTKQGSDGLFTRIVWDEQSHGEGIGSLRFDCLGIHAGNRETADAHLSAPTNQTLVPGNTNCTLTWYSKGEGLTPRSFASVTVFCQSPGPTGVPPAGSKFLQQFAVNVDTDAKEWRKATLTFRTPPETGWIQVRLAAQSDEPNKKFSVWFDDFILTTDSNSQAPAPSDSTATAPGNTEPTNWTARRKPADAPVTGLPGFEFMKPSQPYGTRIQRTMRLLEGSTPARRNRVKMLFYGQSIIGQNWWKRIVADLRSRYPYADIVASNPSIGGFMSDKLKDTMYGDAYPANADLILFHDYGVKEAEMEEMFAGMRGRTTAEVIVFTHHLAGQKAWDGGQTKDSDLIARLAEKYGFECVDIRKNWRSYLEFTATTAPQYLKDIIHLNPAGEALWWKITMPHFQLRPDAEPYWRQWIKVYTADGQAFAADNEREYPDQGRVLTQPFKLTFEGNRVDVLADATAGKPGTAKILIDGKSPSSLPELYYATVGSRPPNFFWPMLRRAQIGKDPVAETWTITFKNMAQDRIAFDYDLKGSVTGPDGSGNSRETFTSNSGRVVIDPRWFTIDALVKSVNKGVPYPDGTACKFSVISNSIDVWKPDTPTDRSGEGRYTLASGLKDGPHTLEIIPNGDGNVSLRAIVVHQLPKH